MLKPHKPYKVHGYTQEQLGNALDEIAKGRSIGQVSKKYDIPKSTLSAKVNGKLPINCTRGPATYLQPEEETRIATWILNKAKLGFPMHPNQVKDAVQKVLNDSKRETVFKDNRPGDPEIGRKNTEILERSRAAVTEENLRDWHRKCKSYLSENGFESVLLKPASIFNADETAVQLSPKLGKRLGDAKSGQDNYEVGAGDDKSTLTVLCGFSASGAKIPPMIMYPYKRLPPHIGDLVPSEWGIGKSDSG